MLPASTGPILPSLGSRISVSGLSAFASGVPRAGR